MKLSGNELQSGEFEIGSGLELYDFNARMYDAQIGRFQSPDPLATLMPDWSGYSYSFNNPVKYTDPTGLYPDDGYGDDDVLDPVSEGCYCSRPGAEILYTEREPDMHAHDEFDDRDLFYFDEKYFENDDQIEKDFANLLSENKYYEAIELIINSYPEMMGQTPKNHIFEVTEKGDQGRHVTQYVQSTDGSYTRFAAGILKLYQGGYSSFGAQVRMIFHERIHIFQYSGKGRIESPFSREILAYYYMLINKVLPPFDLDKPVDKSYFLHWKKIVPQYFDNVPEDQKENHRAKYIKIMEILSQ